MARRSDGFSAAYATDAQLPLAQQALPQQLAQASAHFAHGAQSAVAQPLQSQLMHTATDLGEGTGEFCAMAGMASSAIRTMTLESFFMMSSDAEQSAPRV